MQTHAADRDVFIRSMATRGQLGGLARATTDVALVLDAAGKSLVIIETVGVGQDEVDIVRTADCSIVILVPGTGDEVQALKAGIMEIADIFVVNKADRDGADRMVTAVESNLALQAFGEGEWRPPIIKTEATTGRGIPELWTTIDGLSRPLGGWTLPPPPGPGRVPSARAFDAQFPAPISNDRCWCRARCSRSSSGSRGERSIPIRRRPIS